MLMLHHHRRRAIALVFASLTADNLNEMRTAGQPRWREIKLALLTSRKWFLDTGPPRLWGSSSEMLSDVRKGEWRVA